MKQILTYIFLLLAIAFNVHAQTDISMSTHWYNRNSYNPAAITRTDYLYLFSNVRKQWAGVAGSPESINLEASGYNYYHHSGYGISLTSDQTGLTRFINPMLSYAYRIGKDDEHWFSMGISAGVFSRYIDVSAFDAANDADATLYSELTQLTQPDINAGFEFQSPHILAGLSSTHLLSIRNSEATYLNTTHYYAYLAYKNTNSEWLNYQTGIQTISRSGLTVVEGNISLRFKQPTGRQNGPRELFDIGLAYRSSKLLVLLLGYNIDQNFRVGYAYDQSFVSGYNSNGTHEIMLEYRIPDARASKCNCHNEADWYF